MKILNVNPVYTAIVTCDRCKSVLEITPADVHWTGIDHRYKCSVCGRPTTINDDKLIKRFSKIYS